VRGAGHGGELLYSVRGKERGKEGRRRRKKEKEENGKRKRKREGERERERFAVATAAGRARAPVGRDARDEGEQGDGTTLDSDVGTSFSGDREIGRGRSELIDEKF